MKVAVCVGGLTYPDSEKLMKELQSRFSNYDFFFGTWKGRENELTDKLNAFTFDEPTPEYHPYFDVVNDDTWPPNLQHIIKILKEKQAKKDFHWINKCYHQTKQILMHSYMLDKIPSEYDMIVRTRFDIWLYDKSIPFERFVEESYEQNKPIGFARKMSGQHGAYWSAKGTHRHHWWEGFMCDLILMHPRNLFNKEKVWKLHHEKKLLAAEFGWYQALCEHKSGDHDCYFARINMTSRDGYRKI